MIKMIVVDDEPVIRKGISTAIDWGTIGIEIAGTGKNGEEAVELIKKFEPDIVLTDIKMPYMDGLELAEYISKNYEEMKVIIISGYKDFEYAQRAIKFNVTDYLLKPVGVNELVEVIEKLIEEIKIQEIQQKEIDTNKKIIYENLNHLQAEVVKKIVTGHFKYENDIIEDINKYGINLNGPYFFIMIIEFDDYIKALNNKDSSQKEYLEKNLELLLRSLFENKFQSGIWSFSNNQYVCILNENINKWQEIRCKIEEIQREMLAETKMSITISCSNSCNKLLQLKDLYHQATEASFRKIYFGKEAVIFYDEIKTLNTKIPYTLQEEENFQKAINVYDKPKINQIIRGVFRKFNDQFTEYNQIILVTLRMLTVAQLELFDEDKGVFGEFVTKDIMSELNEIKKVEDIQKWLFCEIDSLLHFKEVQSTKNDEIDLAIKYIKEHYGETIQLDQIAEEVHLSPSYFSRLFKEKTQKKFTEFVNEYRIEKSKELMRTTTLKTYEIADRVGFKDYKYFSSVFRKVTGESPRKWK